MALLPSCLALAPAESSRILIAMNRLVQARWIHRAGWGNSRAYSTLSTRLPTRPVFSVFTHSPPFSTPFSWHSRSALQLKGGGRNIFLIHTCKRSLHTAIIRQAESTSSPPPPPPPPNSSTSSSTDGSSSSSAAQKKSRFSLPSVSWQSFSMVSAKTYLIWGSVGLSLIFLLRAGLGIVNYFATINFLEVGEISFLGGIITGMGMMGVIIYGMRLASLSPDRLFSMSFKRIQSDAVIAQYFTSSVTPMQFKAYNQLPREINFKGTGAGVGLQRYITGRKMQLSVHQSLYA